MKKKIAALALLLAMLAGFVPWQRVEFPTVWAESAIEDFVITNGMLTKYVGSGGAVSIPSTVRAIGDSAFADCTEVTSVTIPDSVSTINRRAFYGCTNLEWVKIPATVTYIGSGAFEECTSLSGYLSIYGQLTRIQDRTFYHCAKLEYVSMPYCVESIGREAFYGCTSMTRVSTPNYLKYIEQNAFSDCTSLESVSLTYTTKSIGAYAFSGCTALKSIELPYYTSSVGEGVFSGCTALQDVTLGASFRDFDEGIFANCPNLMNVNVVSDNTVYESENGLLYWTGKKRLLYCPKGKQGALTLPDSVETISYDALIGCTGVTDITFGASLTDFNFYIFSDYLSLENLHASSDNTAYDSENGVMYSEGKKELLFCPKGKKGALIIPDSVTDIGYQSLENCAGLTEITIPDSITELGYRAFAGCTGLTEITIPDSVTQLGSNAFEGCTGLTKITIPDAVTEIEEACFSDCTGLNTIVIPDSVTAIGYRAFDNCTGLTDVYYSGSMNQWKEISFEGLNNALMNATIHYNSGATPLAITTQPVNATGAVNDKVTFSVSATGTGLTYQWYYKKASDADFVKWSGRTSETAEATVYASWNNSEYYCVVTDKNGNTVRSDTVKLLVATKITQQPTDATGAVNDKVTFTVKATGSGLTYQWYYKKPTDSSWTLWSGRTSASATATVYNSWNGTKYYCKITDANGNTLNSGSAKLTVATPLAITTQPTDATGAVNDKVTFSVAATGSGVKYQWYYKKADASSWTAWKNGTSASLTAPVYASWNGTKFYCKLTDANGKTLNSGSAKMFVATKITTQPTDATGAVNDKVTFTVKATGSGLTYQWYYKKPTDSSWTKWNGRTSASATATVYNSWNGTKYYCKITDANGKTLNSGSARMIVG